MPEFEIKPFKGPSKDAREPMTFLNEDLSGYESRNGDCIPSTDTYSWEEAFTKSHLPFSKDSNPSSLYDAIEEQLSLINHVVVCFPAIQSKLLELEEVLQAGVNKESSAQLSMELGAGLHDLLAAIHMRRDGILDTLRSLNCTDKDSCASVESELVLHISSIRTLQQAFASESFGEQEKESFTDELEQIRKLIDAYKSGVSNFLNESICVLKVTLENLGDKKTQDLLIEYKFWRDRFPRYGIKVADEFIDLTEDLESLHKLLSGCEEKLREQGILLDGAKAALPDSSGLLTPVFDHRVLIARGFGGRLDVALLNYSLHCEPAVVESSAIRLLLWKHPTEDILLPTLLNQFVRSSEAYKGLIGTEVSFINSNILLGLKKSHIPGLAKLIGALSSYSREVEQGHEFEIECLKLVSTIHTALCQICEYLFHNGSLEERFLAAKTVARSCRREEGLFKKAFEFMRLSQLPLVAEFVNILVDVDENHYPRPRIEEAIALIQEAGQGIRIELDDSVQTAANLIWLCREEDLTDETEATIAMLANINIEDVSRIHSFFKETCAPGSSGEFDCDDESGLSHGIRQLFEIALDSKQREFVSELGLQEDILECDETISQKMYRSEERFAEFRKKLIQDVRDVRREFPVFKYHWLTVPNIRTMNREEYRAYESTSTGQITIYNLPSPPGVDEVVFSDSAEDACITDPYLHLLLGYAGGRWFRRIPERPPFNLAQWTIKKVIDRYGILPTSVAQQLFMPGTGMSMPALTPFPQHVKGIRNRIDEDLDINFLPDQLIPEIPFGSRLKSFNRALQRLAILAVEENKPSMLLGDNLLGSAALRFLSFAPGQARFLYEMSEKLASSKSPKRAFDIFQLTCLAACYIIPKMHASKDESNAALQFLLQAISLQIPESLYDGNNVCDPFMHARRMALLAKQIPGLGPLVSNVEVSNKLVPLADRMKAKALYLFSVSASLKMQTLEGAAADKLLAKIRALCASSSDTASYYISAILGRIDLSDVSLEGKLRLIEGLYGVREKGLLRDLYDLMGPVSYFQKGPEIMEYAKIFIEKIGGRRYQETFHSLIEYLDGRPDLTYETLLGQIRSERRRLLMLPNSISLKPSDDDWWSLISDLTLADMDSFYVRTNRLSLEPKTIFELFNKECVKGKVRKLPDHFRPKSYPIREQKTEHDLSMNSLKMIEGVARMALEVQDADQSILADEIRREVVKKVTAMNDSIAKLPESASNRDVIKNRLNLERFQAKITNIKAEIEALCEVLISCPIPRILREYLPPAVIKNASRDKLARSAIQAIIAASDEGRHSAVLELIAYIINEDHHPFIFGRNLDSDERLRLSKALGAKEIELSLSFQGATSDIVAYDVEFRPTRGILTYLSGSICETCFSRIVNIPSKHPNLIFVPFVKWQRGEPVDFIGGTMVLEAALTNGAKAFVIRGFNPRTEELTNISVEDLFERFVDYLSNVAREAGVSMIVVPIPRNPEEGLTNREAVSEYVNRKYRSSPRVKFARPKELEFNGYKIHDCCVMVRALA